MSSLQRACKEMAGLIGGLIKGTLFDMSVSCRNMQVLKMQNADRNCAGGSRLL